MKNQFHPKQQQKYFWNSALRFFVASWGLPGDLVSNIINKKGRNPEIFSLVFWMKLIFHNDILKLTDL